MQRCMHLQKACKNLMMHFLFWKPDQYYLDVQLSTGKASMFKHKFLAYIFYGCSWCNKQSVCIKIVCQGIEPKTFCADIVQMPSPLSNTRQVSSQHNYTGWLDMHTFVESLWMGTRTREPRVTNILHLCYKRLILHDPPNAKAVTIWTLHSSHICTSQNVQSEIFQLNSFNSRF